MPFFKSAVVAIKTWKILYFYRKLRDFIIKSGTNIARNGYIIKECLGMQNNTGRQSDVRFFKSKFGCTPSGLRFQVSGFRFGFLDLGFSSFIGIWFLVFGILFNSCTSKDSKPYDRSLVVTYAELTLFYEKEKMTNKVVDSLYQIKVKDFFIQKGLEQKIFKEVVDELSKHPEEWKMFIQDVTTAMDSLKRIGK